MSREEFINELLLLGIRIKAEQLDKLQKYMDFLILYNEHTNLTSITNKEDIYLKHFYDSLTIAKYVDLKNVNNLLDIGTGAGFPGMVLKILFPQIKVTLLDSNNKKIIFLKALSEVLDVEVDLVNERAEEFIKEKREYYDLVVSRAVAPLPILLELAIPFARVGGLFVAMKANVDDELKATENTHKKLGASIKSINKFDLIKENSNRTIILYEKKNETNKKYPRQYDKIKKNPIK